MPAIVGVDIEIDPQTATQQLQQAQAHARFVEAEQHLGGAVGVSQLQTFDLQAAEAEGRDFVDFDR
jgi:hypothetical protein